MKASSLLTSLARPLRDMPIRNKLISAFIVLTLAPVAAVSLLSFGQSKALIREKTSQYTMDILTETSKVIELKMHAAEQLSKIIFISNETQSALKEANAGFDSEFVKVNVTRQIRKFLGKAIETSDDIDSVYLISGTGVTFSVNLSVNTFTMTDALKQQAEFGEGKGIWCDTDPVTRTIPLVRIVNDLERFRKIGYLIVNVKESSLTDIYRKTALNRNGSLYILGENGGIASHEDKSLLGRAVEEAYAQRILTGSEANGFFVDSIGAKSCYIAYHQVSGAPLKLVSIVPAIEYEREIVILRNALLAVAVLCWTFAIAVALYLSASISKPVRKLYQMMNRVGEGDFKVSCDYTSKDEIGVLNLHFNNMVRQIDTLIKQVYKEQLLKQKAELKSLKMQINPHFLYNTLESINWLAREKGATDVSKMVKALGDLMRTSIGGEDWITLEDELHNVSNYILIQKYRYGEKLKVAFQTETAALGVKVPKLIIQPLVENAIMHGFDSSRVCGEICIQCRTQGAEVVISVTDNGKGIEPDKLASLFSDAHEGSHAGIGLINIHRRIQLYYGEAFGLTVESQPGQGTAVSIHIPCAPSAGVSDSAGTARITPDR